MENGQVRNHLVKMFLFHENCIKDLQEQIHEFEKEVLHMREQNLALVIALDMLKSMDENAISPPVSHLGD